MGEDGRTISDDMSSLLHAAEEWANGRLFGTYSSNNLNSSNSYVRFYFHKNYFRSFFSKNYFLN